MAERTRDEAWITAAIVAVLDENADATLLDVEMAFRDAGTQTYLLAGGPGGAQFHVCAGMPDMLTTIAAVGSTAEQNRARLGRGNIMAITSYASQ